MHIPTHFLISWNLSGICDTDRKTRIGLALCGVLPDLDGLSILAGREAFSMIHHSFGHCLLAILWIPLFVSYWFPDLRRPRIFAGGALLCALHILCDFYGSGGPDGSYWPVLLLWPYSSEHFYSQIQWPLHSPINIVITAVMIMWSFSQAAKNKASFFAFFSHKLDRKVRHRLICRLIQFKRIFQ